MDRNSHSSRCNVCSHHLIFCPDMMREQLSSSDIAVFTLSCTFVVLFPVFHCVGNRRRLDYTVHAVESLL